MWCGAVKQAEHPDASFISASAAEMHGRLRQWPEARELAVRAAELAPSDPSPLQARLTHGTILQLQRTTVERVLIGWPRARVEQ